MLRSVGWEAAEGRAAGGKTGARAWGHNSTFQRVRNAVSAFDRGSPAAETTERTPAPVQVPKVSRRGADRRDGSAPAIRE